MGDAKRVFSCRWRPQASEKVEGEALQASGGVPDLTTLMAESPFCGSISWIPARESDRMRLPRISNAGGHLDAMSHRSAARKCAALALRGGGTGESRWEPRRSISPGKQSQRNLSPDTHQRTQRQCRSLPLTEAKIRFTDPAPQRPFNTEFVGTRQVKRLHPALVLV